MSVFPTVPAGNFAGISKRIIPVALCAEGRQSVASGGSLDRGVRAAAVSAHGDCPANAAAGCFELVCGDRLLTQGKGFTVHECVRDVGLGVQGDLVGSLHGHTLGATPRRRTVRFNTPRAWPDR